MYFLDSSLNESKYVYVFWEEIFFVYWSYIKNQGKFGKPVIWNCSGIQKYTKWKQSLNQSMKAQ